MTSAGSGATPTWTTISSGLTVSDDTSTNATRYLTFTSATSGTITTINTSSTKLQYNPSTGAFTIVGPLNATSGIIDASANTGAINIPKGTTAQRPASPANGAIRYNTTTNSTEIYSGTGWIVITNQTYTVQVIIGNLSKWKSNNNSSLA